MKKLSVLFLAAALVLAFTLPAAAIDHMFGGYWRTRAFTQQNFTGDDNNEAQDLTRVDTRTRLYYTAKFSDDFQFVNKFEFDAVWGDTVLGDIGADGTIFEIKNSYVDFNTWQKKLNWKIGIQGYTIARGFIFSDDFSGLYVAYNGDGWKLPFLWIKAYEGGAGPDANDSDVDYYVLNPAFSYAGFSINPYVMLKYSDDAANYFINGNSRSPQQYNDMNIWWIGADLDYKWEGISFWGTGIFNFGSAEIDTGVNAGQDQDFKGWLLGGGASGAWGPVGIHGQIVYATGDDGQDPLNNDAFFNPRGASYYWSEIMGYGIFDNQVSANSCADLISNILFVGAGVDYKPIESLKLGLDLWYAQKDETAPGADEYLGTEIDFLATYNIMPKLNLDFVFAYLFRGDGTFQGPDEADPIEVGARLSLSF